MTKKLNAILSWILGIGLVASVTLTYKAVILQQQFAGIDFRAFESNICGDEAPSFLWLFDLSSAPGLLFYAYMPMAAISFLFALILLQRKYRSPRNRMLSAALLLFVGWILCILAQWLASYHTVLMFAWQLIAILEMGVYVAATAFAFSFITDKPLPPWAKFAFTGIMLGTMALTPTTLNIPTYDPNICAGTTESPLWNALYFVVQPALIVAIAGFGLAAYRRERNLERRPHIALFTLAFAFFLGMFALSNYLGEISTDYEMNFWGPLGLLISFLMAGYMSMRRLPYHWQTIAAQMMVWGLVTLIGFQFFYIEGTTPFIMNSAAFLATIIFGLLLVRSTTAEIGQVRDQANLTRQRDALERMMGIRMKDLFTKARFLFLAQNEAGKEGVSLMDTGLSAISEVVSARSLRTGEVLFNQGPIDLRAMVLSAAEATKADAAAKNLTVAAEVTDEPLTVLGDAAWLKVLIREYTENAVHYTAAGTITVGLRRVGRNALFWVKDSGPGITASDLPALFNEGGTGVEAAKNQESLGLGLAIARRVAELHGGRVWAESTEGQGATFFAELPLLAG